MRRRWSMKLVWPLLGFVVSNLVIGFGYVIPRSCIAGVNEMTIGFAVTVMAASATYVMGVHAALKSED